MTPLPSARETAAVTALDMEDRGVKDLGVEDAASWPIPPIKELPGKWGITDMFTQEGEMPTDWPGAKLLNSKALGEEAESWTPGSSVSKAVTDTVSLALGIGVKIVSP